MGTRRRAASLLVDGIVVVACVVASCLLGVSAVAGGSMEPAVSRWDLVVYRKAAARPRSGQLVMLGRRGHAWVHRVVRVTDRGTIVTRGDANPIPDLEETSTAAVRGTVVAVIPTGRLLARLASWGGRARLWSQSHT